MYSNTCRCRQIQRFRDDLAPEVHGLDIGDSYAKKDDSPLENHQNHHHSHLNNEDGGYGL